MSESLIYLDNNATTRPFPEVVEAMAACFRDCYGNPGSRHAAGRRARQALEDARESMAAILDADPKEVIFTSGGTEATNQAVFAFAQGTPGKIALTAGEHPATTESYRLLQTRGWNRHELVVDSGGLLLEDQYSSLPWDELRLVTVILAHNETGVIQNLRPLADLCAQHRVPLHVDAVQAVGKVPVCFHELGATTLSLGAHKFHGPRGIGALLIRDGVQVSSYLFGGHQERGVRPGTEPVALAVGMARALEIWHAEAEQRMKQLAQLRDRLERGLSESCGPVAVNGCRDHRLPNTLNISLIGIDGEALLVALDLEGIACSLGSTCASGSSEPAPSLVAMGCPPEVYRSAVRFSVGIENTPEEIDEAVRRVSSVVQRLRGSAATGS